MKIFLPGGTFQQLGIPVPMWNYHHEVLVGFPQATKSVEAWDRSFNATVGCYHATIRKFIQAIKLEQGIAEKNKQAKYISGDKPTKRYKNHHHEESPKPFVGDYFNRPMMEFLRGIAHHIGLDKFSNSFNFSFFYSSYILSN